LWDRARVSFPKNQKDPKKTFALEVRPEEVKVLYARVVALQSLMDGRLDPREIEYLYVFMSRVDLSSDSREEVRQTLATTEASPEKIARLVEEVISAVRITRKRSPSPSSRTWSTSRTPTTWCLSGKRQP
jgi:hypothetical protein